MGIILDWDKYERTLANAFAVRLPIPYIVSGLFALPSLNVVYGHPSCLKSLLLADMLVCVAAGIPWLEKAPWETKALLPFNTNQNSVMWLDFDNGQNRTDNRFEALGKQYGLHTTAPLFYYSMPSPILNASMTGHIMDLIDLVKYKNVGLLVVDNLSTISGNRDENTHEMLQVMTNLRLLAERTGAAIIVIHHSRKDTWGSKGKPGDNLRGFSGIAGALDVALFIDREPGSNIVTVTATKSRDVDINTFGATFTYVNKVGCHDLEKCRFYGTAVVGGQVCDQEIEDEISAVLNASGCGLTQTKLVAEVKKTIKAGEKRVIQIVKIMASQGLISMTQGNRGAYVYSI